MEISCGVNACSSLIRMLHFKLLSYLPQTNPEKDLSKCCDRLDVTTMTTCQTQLLRLICGLDFIEKVCNIHV